MKFMKFGKAFLISALSAVVVLGLTSCAQSYSVGYLYVTGTVTSDSSGNGIVSGFKIDHNTGKLTSINGMPVSSGGANPSRAVLLDDGRYLYVLNRGTNASGGSICTTADPCQNSNITQFAVGANGSLTAQQTFYTQGLNPFRIIADSAGSYIYVLDHDSIGTDGKTPSTTSNPNAACTAALGEDSSGASITTCGDITAFSVNATTGRLSLVQNTQVQVSNTNLTYFPVPSNSVDFVLSSTYVLTLSGTSASVDSSTGAYTGGTRVFPYNYVSTSGQLTATGTAYPWNTLTDSSSTGVPSATAIVSGGGYIYVLDNNPIYLNGSSTASSQSQILPYTISTNGALAAATSGAIADDADQSNPIYLIVENKGTWFYVANQGNNSTSTSTAQSGIAGYVINSPYEPTEMSGTPVGFGSGAGPQCLVEDPSDQFIYTANFNSSSVTGQSIDQNAGTLTPLSQSTKASSTYSLTGPPTWCLVTGRTN